MRGEGGGEEGGKAGYKQGVNSWWWCAREMHRAWGGDMRQTKDRDVR